MIHLLISLSKIVGLRQEEWEVQMGLDPLINDVDADSDRDNLSNLAEYQYGTHPFKLDSDSDGLTDYEEVKNYFTNPLRTDSDVDGLIDSDEVNMYATDPNNADSDMDGLTDYSEVKEYIINPLDPDPDTDGLTDSE
ncbi:MAG: hypothetical protein ACFFCQ_12580 [Promethearchaeota archaeon]